MMNKTFQRNPDVVYRSIAGEGLLVPVRGDGARTRKLFSLNELGASIWALMEKKQTLAELVQLLQERYRDIDPERIRSETEAFVSRLALMGLLIEAESDGL